MKNAPLIVGILLVVWCCVPMSATGDTVIDLPPEGSDISSHRCDGGIVSVGDHFRLVAEKCGDPVDRGNMPHRKYDVWVYHTPGANFVYYFAFFNRNLQRIYSVSCNKNDPYCD
jgi:hypothetical protein